MKFFAVYFQLVVVVKRRNWWKYSNPLTFAQPLHVHRPTCSFIRREAVKSNSGRCRVCECERCVSYGFPPKSNFAEIVRKITFPKKNNRVSYWCYCCSCPSSIRLSGRRFIFSDWKLLIGLSRNLPPRPCGPLLSRRWFDHSHLFSSIPLVAHLRMCRNESKRKLRRKKPQEWHHIIPCVWRRGRSPTVQHISIVERISPALTVIRW